MTTRTWTGLAGDNLWPTNGNWSGNTAPTSADDVVLSGSATIDMNDALQQCLSINASAFTGTLTNGALWVNGPNASFGAGSHVSLNEGGGLRLIVSATLTCGAGCLIDWLNPNAGTTCTFASDVHIGDFQVNAGATMAVGTNDLSVDFLDISNGAATWTWSGPGQVTFTAGASVQSAVAQQTPSLPPIVISNGLTLTGGDMTVDHIVSESGSIVLNGNHIIETNPPVAPAITASGVQAQTLTALETAVNTALAGLTDPILHGVDIAAYVDQRRMGIDLRAVVTSVDQGPTLATPFVLKTFTSQLINSDVDAVTALQQQVQAFITANPSYFFTAARLIFVDVGYREPQYIAWLIYNTTAGASANYALL